MANPANPLALAIADLLAPVEGYHQGPQGIAMRDIRRGQNAALVEKLVAKLGLSLDAAADAVLATEEALAEPTLFDLIEG